MWKIVLIAVLIALAFGGVLLFAGGGATSKSVKPQSYQPPAWTELLGTLTAPFAPDAALPQSRFMPRGGNYPKATVPASTTDFRVARFDLLSPGAVLVNYVCHGGPADGCTQSACLISAPAISPAPACPAQSGGTPEQWRPCVSLLVHAGGGEVSFQAKAGAPTVQQVTGSAASTAPGCGSH